jgi:hypothetical protein
VGRENGSIRVINYVAGHNADDTPIIRFRFEQLWDGHWNPVPVFQDVGDGKLQEIRQ